MYVCHFTWRVRRGEEGRGKGEGERERLSTLSNGYFESWSSDVPMCGDRCELSYKQSGLM